MTIDEAIKHAQQKMVENLDKTKDRNASDPVAIQCFDCASEHNQLAKWLEELKAYREAYSDIKRLNISWEEGAGIEKCIAIIEKHLYGGE